MEEVVSMIANNGIGICCVAYIIWFQSTTMQKMLTALESINNRLTVIETKIEDKK